MSMNTLPTRDELQKAIEPWWRRGGLSSLLVDVLRGRAASLEEAEAVAERLADRAASGLNIISREIVEETVEMMRAISAYRRMKQEQEAKIDSKPQAWRGTPVPIPNDVKTKVNGLLKKWTQEEPTLADAQAEWDRNLHAILTGPKLTRSPCVHVFGQRTVIRGRHVVCPSCDEDLCRDCPPQVKTG